MNWDDLQLFAAVAKTGNFLGAGARLGVDRTTISRRLAALEEQLGVALLARSRTGVTVTAAGARVLEHAARMEHEAAAVAQAAEAGRAVQGRVRIAVTDALATFLVQQGLLSLRDEYPTLELELLAGNRRLDLAAGEADVAIRVDPLKGANLRARCVARDEVAVYAAASYLRQRGAPVEPRHLNGHDVLLPAGELAGLPEGRWLATQAGVRVALASNNLPALVAAAREGRGLVALVDTWGRREPQLERLFAVPGLPRRAMWVVTTTLGTKRPAIATVTRRLASLFAAPQRELARRPS